MPDNEFKALLKMQKELAEALINMQKELALDTGRVVADALDRVGSQYAEAYREINDALAAVHEALTKLSSRLDDLERRLPML